MGQENKSGEGPQAFVVFLSIDCVQPLISATACSILHATEVGAASAM